MNRRILIALVLALLLSVALSSVVSAHAKLVSSDPAAGAKLDKAPAKITLVFTEEISANAIDSFFNVTDEQGANVGSGKLDTNDLDHKTLSGTLNAGRGDGLYTVAWQTITTDDNGKSTGSFIFGVNKAPGAQPTTAPDSEEPTAAATAQPTAAAGAAPTTLPTTGDSGPNMILYFLVAVIVLVAGGLALRGATKRAR
jgi:copper transport protein